MSVIGRCVELQCAMRMQRGPHQNQTQAVTNAERPNLMSLMKLEIEIEIEIET